MQLTEDVANFDYKADTVKYYHFLLTITDTNPLHRPCLGRSIRPLNKQMQMKFHTC